MWVVRAVPFALPQVLVLLYLGARFDLLLGFNRTDAGLTVLLALAVLSPVAATLWLFAEVVGAFVEARRKAQRVSFLLPAIALGTLLQALLVDLLLLSQARM